MQQEFQLPKLEELQQQFNIILSVCDNFRGNKQERTALDNALALITEVLKTAYKPEVGEQPEQVSKTKSGK